MAPPVFPRAGIAQNRHFQKFWREGVFLVSLGITFFVLACLVSYDARDGGFSLFRWQFPVANTQNFGGRLGAACANFLYEFWGQGAYMLAIAPSILAWHYRNAYRFSNNAMLVLRAVSLLIALPVIFASLSHDPQTSISLLPQGNGGFIGSIVYNGLSIFVGEWMGLLILLALLVPFSSLGGGFSWLSLMDKIGITIMSWVNRSRAEQLERRSIQAQQNEAVKMAAARQPRSYLRNQGNLPPESTESDSDDEKKNRDGGQPPIRNRPRAKPPETVEFDSVAPRETKPSNTPPKDIPSWMLRLMPWRKAKQAPPQFAPKPPPKKPPVIPGDGPPIDPEPSELQRKEYAAEQAKQDKDAASRAKRDKFKANASRAGFAASTAAGKAGGAFKDALGRLRRPKPPIIGTPSPDAAEESIDSPETTHTQAKDPNPSFSVLLDEAAPPLAPIPSESKSNAVSRPTPVILPTPTLFETSQANASLEATADENIEKKTPKSVKIQAERRARDEIPEFLPKSSLLHPPPPEQKIETRDLSEEILAALRNFGIKEAVICGRQPGPVVTCYELHPGKGVKSAQIASLSKDLARSLSVRSVRVVEVIPGKPYIGLELPNENRQHVAFREILESIENQNSPSALTMCLGKDIIGHPVVANLEKMPHLLVAGTTGSGKSVAVNVMILSLLFRASPDDVRMLMIDPKMLELSIYNDIPHLLAPVVTDMKDAANALRWAVSEMERRYKLMAGIGVRHLAGFNQKISEYRNMGMPLRDPTWQALNPEAGGMPPDHAPELEKLPFIVIVVDELADMMMIVGKKVEELIARLAQKARAAGIHLILATQRPSVDVVTGLIKANIPTRISFQVQSRIDSRTVLDQMGAENLLGQGDMLYLPPGSGIPNRVHGAFVSDEEVHKIADHWRAQGQPNYVDMNVALDEFGMDEELPKSKRRNADSENQGETLDALYDQAVQLVCESRKASISWVQRRLRVGYNRAANLVEQMESNGVVGPLQSNGNRVVLAPVGG